MATLLASTSDITPVPGGERSSEPTTRRQRCDHFMSQLVRRAFQPAEPPTEPTAEAAAEAAVTSTGGLLVETHMLQEFVTLCEWNYGRISFAKALKTQRVDNSLTKDSFNTVLKLVRTAVQSAEKAEHDVPAFHLLPAIFSLSCVEPTGLTMHMYTLLQDLPLWQLPRFWEASFCHTMIIERRKRALAHKRHNVAPEDDRPGPADGVFFDKEVVFAQLGTYCFNMLDLGAERNVVDQFLSKMCKQAALSADREQHLHTSVVKKHPVLKHVTLAKETLWGFGLTLGVVDGSVVVASLSFFGPASRSEQVAVGDVLLQVDGSDMRGATLEAANELLTALTTENAFVFGG
eukprot:m.480567 g.480567  ORF g.480567 m.480567 type:complete len:347 (+) comp21892_c0_seq1:160-1200(+)